MGGANKDHPGLRSPTPARTLPTFLLQGRSVRDLALLPPSNHPPPGAAAAPAQTPAEIVPANLAASVGDNDIAYSPPSITTTPLCGPPSSRRAAFCGCFVHATSRRTLHSPSMSTHYFLVLISC